MVKHRVYDLKGGSFKVLKSEDKLHFFCFRCNVGKQAGVQVHWSIPEIGDKVICNQCWEDVMVKQEKQAKKRKTDTPKEEVAPDWPLCPILLEEQNGDWKQQISLEKITSHISDMKPETTDHYHSQICGSLILLGYNPEGSPAPDAKWDVMAKCLQQIEESEKAFNLFTDEQKKPLRKVRSIAQFNVDKAEHGEEWSHLKSLEDIRKIHAVTERYLHTVVPNILPMWAEYIGLRKVESKEQKISSNIKSSKAKSIKKRKNSDASDQSNQTGDGKEEVKDADAESRQRILDLLTEFFKLFLTLGACAIKPQSKKSSKSDPDGEALEQDRIQIRKIFATILDAKFWTKNQRTKLEDLNQKVQRVV
eukprot:TRINITY_DN2705_c0_g1_i1.p1 TRINITY_DN2705_c0_g1~~TRINITY_DN2705_c0_g1_i1.p1  ORF type:complete len:363 (-),score=114.69 TRINITY_DN2705_c0_g1_i1:52-1140(-)